MPVTLRWHSSLMRWCSSPGHCSNLLYSHAMLTLITGMLSCNIPRYSIFSVKHARVDESSVSQSGKSISHKPQFLLMLLYGSWRFYPRGTNHVLCTVGGGERDVSFTSFRGTECIQSWQYHNITFNSCLLAFSKPQVWFFLVYWWCNHNAFACKTHFLILNLYTLSTVCASINSIYAQRFLANVFLKVTDSHKNLVVQMQDNKQCILVLHYNHMWHITRQLSLCIFEYGPIKTELLLICSYFSLI